MGLSVQARQKGFTLMEIMLVIVVLGILASVTVVNGFSGSRSFDYATAELSQTLQYATDRAEREGSTLGLVMCQTGWQLMAYQGVQGKTAWKKTGRISSSLPDDASFSLKMENTDVSLPPCSHQETSVEPQLWFYPGGETSVFTITLHQGLCIQQVHAPGFMTFSTSETQCDDN